MRDDHYHGVSVAECFDCQGTGADPHGNTCIFCNGLGAVDEREDESDRDDAIDEDELVTPTQKERGDG